MPSSLERSSGRRASRWGDAPPTKRSAQRDSMTVNASLHDTRSEVTGRSEQPAAESALDLPPAAQGFASSSAAERMGSAQEGAAESAGNEGALQRTRLQSRARGQLQSQVAGDPGLRMALALQAEPESVATGGRAAMKLGSLRMGRRSKGLSMQEASDSYVAAWK